MKFQPLMVLCTLRWVKKKGRRKTWSQVVVAKGSNGGGSGNSRSGGGRQ